jgi:hypothetical protein
MGQEQELTGCGDSGAGPEINSSTDGARLPGRHDEGVDQYPRHAAWSNAGLLIEEQSTI